MTIVVKNTERPDELRNMPNGNGRGAIVKVGAMTVVRGELQPRWRWSNDLRPLTGTTSCEFPHTGILLTGCLHMEMDDDTAVDLRPGDVYGHQQRMLGGQG